MYIHYVHTCTSHVYTHVYYAYMNACIHARMYTLIEDLANTVQMLYI